MIHQEYLEFETTIYQKEVQGLTEDNSNGCEGKFLPMVELRKKILRFRDIIDLPPCDEHSPIKELLTGTVGDLHDLYPKIVPSISTSEIDETEKSLHKVFAKFYPALKSVGNYWVKHNKWLNEFTYEKEDIVDEMSVEQLVGRVLPKLDNMIKVAQEIFEVMDNDDQQEESPRYSMFGDILSKSYSDNKTSCCLSPVTPTSVLPETINSSINNVKFANYSYSPSLLRSLRLQAVRNLNPIDLRLSFHLPNASSPGILSSENQTSKTPVETKIKESNRNSAAAVFVAATREELKDSRGIPKIISSNLNERRNEKANGVHDSEPIDITGGSKMLPKAPLPMPISNLSALISPLKQMLSQNSDATSHKQQPKLPDNVSETTPLPPNMLAVKALATPPSPPPLVAIQESPVPLPKMLHTKSSPVSLPPPMLSSNGSVPLPPPHMKMTNGTGSSPPPPINVHKTNGTGPPPPPPINVHKTSGSGPPPPPLLNVHKANVNGPPPPPQNVQKKAVTKLKRSPNMANLYRLLKKRVEGSNVDGKSSNGKKNQAGGSGGAPKQSMADALAEMTKRSAYFQQIEEDVQKHAKTIMEMKAAISSFQSKDMPELLKFHKYVESHLECLTDETQVLTRFEDFPNKKLETLRTAAALHLKLNSMVTNLENWKIVSPLNRLLEMVDSYFNKIKGELDTLERTKDDELKRFKSQNIYFDFNILIKIKELIVDLSSGCMELALKERKQVKAEVSGKPGPKADKQLDASSKMLWKAFQLAFRVYTFAGGQDDRAERLSKELAQEIETDPQN